MVFWYYEITNIAKQDYTKTVFAQYVDWGIGGTDDSSDDRGLFDKQLDIAWANGDVVALLRAANVEADLRDVNPYAFAEPVAPHIAAQEASVHIELDCIAAAYARLAAAADVVVVEGAGGWCVPLNEREDMADLAQRLGLPVVLVVGLRLGCLNHALLTAESIAHRHVPWAGWVGNHVDPEMARQAENIAALHARLPAPCLGEQEFLRLEATSMGAPQWLRLPNI